MDLKYIFDCSKNDIADGELSIILKNKVENNQYVRLFWADENDVLADYLPICTLKAESEEIKYTLGSNRIIPMGAKKLVAKTLKIDEEKNENYLIETCKFTIPCEKTTEIKSPNYRFFLISDIHGAGDYWYNEKNRESCFRDINTFSPKFVLMSGDITNAGQGEQYEKVKGYLTEFFPKTPFLISTGNHDFNTYVPNLLPDLEAMKDFFNWQVIRNNKIGANINELHNLYFDSYIDENHIIVLNTCNVDNKFEVGEEQLIWLEEKLCESDGNKIPTIVINHFPVAGKVGYYAAKNNKGLKDNDEFEKILNKHNCISVSGHTHYNLDSDDINIYIPQKNEKVAHINAGCAVWTQNGYNDKGEEQYLPERCFGICVEVFDDYLIFKGRDFTQSKFVPRCIHKLSI